VGQADGLDGIKSHEVILSAWARNRVRLTGNTRRDLTLASIGGL
jgi:hypothetical protein